MDASLQVRREDVGQGQGLGGQGQGFRFKFRFNIRAGLWSFMDQ